MRNITVILFLLTASLGWAEETRGRFPEKMVVTVVDEAGKPITHANGFHRFGQFIDYRVDENGVFEIPMSEEKLNDWPVTDFTVRADGYGPFMAHFDEDPILPETFTVVLKPAQKIGGVVVDEEGNPLEGVGVELFIRPETVYKVSQSFVDITRTTTDADGKWSIFQLPATFNLSPSFSLNKEGYLQTSVSSIPVSRLNPDADGQFNEKIVLERGYAFSGRVVDEAGTPLEGVTLQLGTWGSGTSIHSDKDGQFLFENCGLTDQNLLVVYTPGKAPQLLLVEIRSENEPMEIVMAPGRTLTFEVTDSAGQPVKDAEFVVKVIDGLPGRHSYVQLPFFQGSSKTDESGQFVWNDAPIASCVMSCGLRGYIYVDLHIKPDQETVSVTLYRSLVKLRVLSEETGEPIPAFLVTMKLFTNPEDERSQSRFRPVPGTDGAMETHVYGGDYRAWQFDVQSPGYETTASRKVVHGEEGVELEIRLKKAAEIATPVAETADQPVESKSFPLSGGTILTPEGAIAAQATIEAAAKNSGSRSEVQPVFSNDQGEFLLSDGQLAMIGEREFVLKITHASGAAVIPGSDFRNRHDRQANADAEPIQLSKWGRIEGTLQSGGKKLEGTSMAVRWVKPDSLPVVPYAYQGTTTKKDGRFVFEQVIPGTVSITRSVPAGNLSSSWSTYCGSFEVKPGETTFCAIGTTGRAVIGRAIVPGTITAAQYTARIVLRPEDLADLKSPTLPKELWYDPFATDPKALEARRQAWDQTDEGKEHARLLERNNKAVRNLRFAIVNKDGTFRFDGLPAGDYALMISETENCGMDCEAGEWHHLSTFTVDDADETLPMDLGELPFFSNK